EAEEGLASAVPQAVLELLREPPGPPVWVVGSGHVAAHAVPWLRAQGRTVLQLGARALVAGTQALPSGPVAGAWVLARDPALPAVARALAEAMHAADRPTAVPVLHGAGACRADEALRPLADRGHPVGTLHPICSLRAERPWPSPLLRAAFGIEGDPPARALAHSWVGARPWLDLQALDARGRRAYHAACALAANHLAVPYAAAHDVLVAQGHAEATVRAALDELLRSALDNLLRLGLPGGITGPV